MREIIGEKMDNIFAALGINPKETFKGCVGYWDDFSVWEITDEDFKILDDMTDEEFEKYTENYPWWRYAEGSVLGVPDHEFTVNGEKLIAWYDADRDKDLIEDFETEDEAEKEGGLEQYIATWHTTEFPHLLEYFCTELGASTEKNVSALATDLARYNNITISELFRKYGGSYHGNY